MLLRFTAAPSRRQQVLVVGGNGGGVHFCNPVPDDLLHLADAAQVGENVAFAELVENPLAVHEHFHNALAPGGDGYGNVGAEGMEELIRHPRGGSVMLSRNAISDFYLDFTFHSVFLLSIGES